MMVIISLMFLATKQSPSNYPKEINFEKIANGYYSNIGEPYTRTFTNTKDWNRYYSLLKPSGNAPHTAPPKIDFSKYTVIAIGLGELVTGGNSIKILGIGKLKDVIQVTFRETRPGMGCMVSQGINQPYYIVKIPKTKKPITFLKFVEKKSCEKRK